MTWARGLQHTSFRKDRKSRSVFKATLNTLVLCNGFWLSDMEQKKSIDMSSDIFSSVSRVFQDALHMSIFNNLKNSERT